MIERKVMESIKKKGSRGMFSVAWVDREHARLFHFSDEQIERKNLHVRQPEHHTHHKEGDDREYQRFYRQISDHLKESDCLLILGPGIAKYHLKTHILDHFPALGRRIIGCETVDHPTDRQIAACAMRYFSAGKSSQIPRS